MPLKPNHHSPVITAEQRCNLIKLARGLLFEDRKSRFHMGYYCAIDGRVTSIGNEVTAADYSSCGTAACAAGHGPLFVTAKRPSENWTDYSSRVFIDYYTEGNTSAYAWCFSGSWAIVDNTPEGAAKRILYMLKFGVPNDFGCTKETVALYSNLTLEELDQCTEELSHVQA